MKRPEWGGNEASKYPLKKRFVLRTAPRLTWFLLRGLCSSCRISVIDKSHFDEVQQQHGTVVVGIWHETLASALNIYRNTGYCTMTSQSFDGELAARICSVFGIDAVRGSSTRGGAEALRQIVLTSQNVYAVGFTLDGPKGPRRVAKPGIALLSARTGVPIVPNAIAAVPCWRIKKSWDQMAFPKPFSRIICAYAPPIPAPGDTRPETIEATRLEVETRLNELHDRIENQQS